MAAARPITDLLAYCETVQLSFNTPDGCIKLCVSSDNPTVTSPISFKESGDYELFVHISPASRPELVHATRPPRSLRSTFSWNRRRRHCLFFGLDTMIDEQGNIVEKQDVSGDERERCREAVWVVHWNMREVVCHALDRVPNITAHDRLDVEKSLLDEFERLCSATMGIHPEGQRRKIALSVDLSPHIVSRRGKADPEEGRPRYHKAGCGLFRALVCLHRDQKGNRNQPSVLKLIYDTDDENAA